MKLTRTTKVFGVVGLVALAVLIARRAHAAQPVPSTVTPSTDLPMETIMSGDIAYPGGSPIYDGQPQGVEITEPGYGKGVWEIEPWSSGKPVWLSTEPNFFPEIMRPQIAPLAMVMPNFGQVEPWAPSVERGIVSVAYDPNLWNPAVYKTSSL